MKYDLIAEARKFALAKHDGQMYGELPYDYHLADVVKVAKQIGQTDVRFIAACWLHDILEDTDTDRWWLRHLFGEFVSDLVWRVTDEPGKNRKERKALTYSKIAADPNAVLLKLCDRIANMESGLQTKNYGILKMYLNEHSDFTNALCGSPATGWERYYGVIAKVQAEIVKNRHKTETA